VAVPASATLGDVMTYQRQRGLIQDKLRAALAAHAPGHGSQAQPISVLAHSLGGVIAFDAAMDPPSEAQRLWIKSFVTFGSQSAFFHIVDPRTSLARYRQGAPVKLGPSIARWTNLWNTMDVLAFTAGTVFRLADGSIPRDICVQESISEIVQAKGWTHSVYWTSDDLLSAARGRIERHHRAHGIGRGPAKERLVCVAPRRGRCQRLGSRRTLKTLA
jgi:hypothetical protein